MGVFFIFIFIFSIFSVLLKRSRHQEEGKEEEKEVETALSEAELRKIEEEILYYKFNDKKLLNEALIHPSFYPVKPSISYERLEYLGDSVLNLLLARELFLLYPDLAQGQLTKLRSANVDTENLARVAVKHDFHDYLREKTPLLKQQIEEFRKEILDLEYPVRFYGLIDPPKALADIVESIAGAVFIDSHFSLETVWRVFKRLLEPIINQETLGTNPVSELTEFCQKKGLELRFKFIDDLSSENTTVKVFVGGNLVGKATFTGERRKKSPKIGLPKLPWINLHCRLPPQPAPSHLKASNIDIGQNDFFHCSMSYLAGRWMDES